ncbi:hypothetical protein NKG94_16340 [Micromonospora sp. M12]
MTVIFALRQLRSAQTANQTLVAIELLTRDRSSDEFLRAEDFVLKELTVRHPPPHVSVSDLPAEARHHVVRLSLYYNGLGQMLALRRSIRGSSWVRSATALGKPGASWSPTSSPSVPSAARRTCPTSSTLSTWPRTTRGRWLSASST